LPDSTLNLARLEIVPFGGDELRAFLAQVAGAAEAVAVTSVFASVSDAHEAAAAEIVREELGDLPVSLSHEIGSIGLLERENGTVMNAALRSVASGVATALEAALAAHDLEPVIFFAQNDGTLMALDYAVRHPVLTIGSGPANSIRGAAYLTGASDTLVADVGGTSTDVGVLVNGFPRESSAAVDVGGVRTNFRMPDLVAIALGGGSIVEDAQPVPLVGPASWDLIAPALAEPARQVTIPDLTSTIAAGPPWCSRQAELIARAAAGRPAVLVGHSGAGPLLAAAGAMIPQVRGYVFVDARGSRLRPDYLTRRLGALITECGLPPIRLRINSSRPCS